MGSFSLAGVKATVNPFCCAAERKSERDRINSCVSLLIIKFERMTSFEDLNVNIDSDVVVIDVGGYETKAGLAGYKEPSAVYRSIIGKPKPIQDGPFPADLELCLRNGGWVMGPIAFEHKDLLIGKNPVAQRKIQNWDEGEKIWRHAIERELKLKPAEHPVLLTDSPTSTTRDREEMITRLFESFSSPSAFIHTQPALALLATNRSSGIVIDSGEDMTHAVPIYQGFILPHTKVSNIGGKHVTLELVRLAGLKSYPRDFVTMMKEHCTHVELNPQQPLNVEGHYTLPDDSEVTIGHEAYNSTEILFRPSATNKSFNVMLKDILNLCDGSFREVLSSNVILSGGNTMFPGLAERLEQDCGVKVYAGENRKHFAWIGGSVFSCLDTSKKLFITKAEYEEHGAARITAQKCPFPLIL
jgi:actin